MSISVCDFTVDNFTLHLKKKYFLKTKFIFFSYTVPPLGLNDYRGSWRDILHINSTDYLFLNDLDILFFIPLMTFDFQRTAHPILHLIHVFIVKLACILFRNLE